MRKALRALGLIVILVPCTLFEVACGGHSTSPTAPSASPSANGVVGSLSGSCPSLVMNVSGVVVKTGPATTFTNGVCADIKVGTSLYSNSTRQSDGSLLADFVQVVR